MLLSDPAQWLKQPRHPRKRPLQQKPLSPRCGKSPRPRVAPPSLIKSWLIASSNCCEMATPFRWFAIWWASAPLPITTGATRAKLPTRTTSTSGSFLIFLIGARAPARIPRKKPSASCLMLPRVVRRSPKPPPSASISSKSTLTPTGALATKVSGPLLKSVACCLKKKSRQPKKRCCQTSVRPAGFWNGATARNTGAPSASREQTAKAPCRWKPVAEGCWST